MKYFKIEVLSRFPEYDQVLGHANGKLIPNAAAIFDEMGKDGGYIIKDLPVLDYFFLQSYGEEKDWEWRLQDFHRFIGEYPTGGCWYISNRFKELLERFVLAGDYWFYPTKLLYKGEKLDYWIFQHAIEWNKKVNMMYINFKKSHFWNEDSCQIADLDTYDDFITERSKIHESTDYEKSLLGKRIVLNQYVDFIALHGYYKTVLGEVVSEKLKTAIEEAGLEGFIFTEIECDIIIEE
jgi:hypothetical protein